MEVRFVADTMLGRLAKWLRAMGCDTYYRPFYEEGTIARFVHDGRLLLSRHRRIINQHPGSLLILNGHVKEQLLEIKDRGYLTIDRSKWFSRCLICNLRLCKVDREAARENIPEYIFYQNIPEIHSCPSCGRHFWPGSHRRRMIRQLDEWGFREL